MTPDRERAQAARECFYCASEPEPGWIEMPNNGPIASCPICNGDGAVPHDLKRRSR